MRLDGDPLAFRWELSRRTPVALLGENQARGQDCDFVTALYQGSLHGSHPTTGTTGELSSGVSTLSAAQAQGPAALLTAAQSLGSTIFNSSAYTGLGTSNAQFVSDLYTGFLQRPPDDSGQSYWLGVLK